MDKNKENSPTVEVGPADADNVFYSPASIIPGPQTIVKCDAVSDCDVVLAHLGDFLAQVRRGESDWEGLMRWAHRPEIEALVQKYADAGRPICYR